MKVIIDIPEQTDCIDVELFEKHIDGNRLVRMNCKRLYVEDLVCIRDSCHGCNWEFGTNHLAPCQNCNNYDLWEKKI